MNHELEEQVAAWLAADPDPLDVATLQQFLDEGNEAELQRRFSAPLTFGTAGLRGPVMAGPAGMNRCTVRRATQGVAHWLEESGADCSLGVVVGRDARHGSEAFNDEVVAVLLGAGIVVHEMPRPLPTPLVAFAVKELRAVAGIMITASHNPPGDNGYKLFAADGSQIIAPDDATVEYGARTAGPPTLGERTSPLHHYLTASLLARYRDHFASRFGVKGGTDFPITYTPLHGVGGVTMMELFVAAGYRGVNPVASQFVPDADFSTLAFPNPEEPGALDLALAEANATGSSLVVANDPDADRLGVAVKGREGWRVLRGDEIGWLIASAILEDPGAPGNVMATTIVSSTMLEKMVEKHWMRFARTLTGFKWIGRAAGEGILAFGYEEALGYAVDPLVADKDGMSAALALCRLAVELDGYGASLLDRLDELEKRYGVHAGCQVAIRAEGDSAMATISASVARLLVEPPATLGGQDVTMVVDLATGFRGLPPTEGVYLQFGDAGWVVVRPSGTEPKLKAYLELTPPRDDKMALAPQRAAANIRLTAIAEDLERRLRL